MFIDESIYLYWARRVASEGRLWRPLADGKSLQVWVLATVVPWVSDPLPWGRMTSALAGGAGMWAAWAIGRRLEGPRAGLVAAGLYVVCPFALFHDRMVLADVFVSSAAALTLLASLWMVERPTPSRGAVLGLAMAACALSKIPGLLFWAIPLLTAIALAPRKAGVPRAVATAFGVAAVLSAFPVWYFFANSAQVQEQAANSDVGGPLAVAPPNLTALAGWLWAYWTPGVVAVFAVVVVVALLQRRRADLLLAAVALWPPAAFALLSRSWFPRYVFASTIPALVLTALALSRLTGRTRGLRRGWVLRLAAAAALLVPALRFDFSLLTRPDHAPLPAVDRLQYVEGWMAGYGRMETARALAEALRQSPAGIVVGVGGGSRHAWRPLHLLLRARFMNEPRVEIAVMDPRDPQARAALSRRAGSRPAYVAVGLDGGLAPVGARPLLVDRRADGSAATVLYRLPLEAATN